MRNFGFGSFSFRAAIALIVGLKQGVRFLKCLMTYFLLLMVTVVLKFWILGRINEALKCD